jgi:hypothetical protein
MNTFEDIFKLQQTHHLQHLARERAKQTQFLLLDDPSCIICYPPAPPSEQSLTFRVFLKWARLILGARQYTNKTIVGFESIDNFSTLEEQELRYRYIFHTLNYNRLPDILLTKLLN